MTTVLVTGANGFVGQTVCARLLAAGCHVRATARFGKCGMSTQDRLEWVVVEAIDPDTNWEQFLLGAEAVVHLAARVHVMNDVASDPVAEFRNLNVRATERLASEAARFGVRRLVYVSSVKVNGERTPAGRAFTELDAHAPQDPYGVSKSEAEGALARIAQETGLEVVIVRPPLVYGPGVKGNFLTMLKAIDRGVPFPLKGITNLRSLIYVENLADAILRCVQHPAAGNKTFLVSDGHDVSTRELMSQVAECMNVPIRLFPIPEVLLRLAGNLIGKREELDRLIGSLVVDSGKIRRELEWSPPHTFCEGIQRTVNWFKGIS